MLKCENMYYKMQVYCSITLQYTPLTVVWYLYTGLHVQIAYTSLRTSSMQIPLLSARCSCTYDSVREVQNAYMHEQSTKEFGVRIVAGNT